MRTFGLTGGICTGKSTVSKMLTAKGIQIVDADVVARWILTDDPRVIMAVRQRWPDVMDSELVVNTRRVRNKIMDDAGERAWFEGLMGSHIKERIEDTAASVGPTTPAFGVESALLIEKGFTNYDDIVVVTCSPETQLARIMERDQISEADARKIMAVQMPLEEKARHATIVIHNDGSREDLEKQVNALASRLTGDTAGIPAENLYEIVCEAVLNGREMREGEYKIERVRTPGAPSFVLWRGDTELRRDRGHPGSVASSYMGYVRMVRAGFNPHGDA